MAAAWWGRPRHGDAPEPPMSTPYAGRHAQLYDVFYADKPYGAQAKWISSLLPLNAAVLDVACGTGGHALALTSRGHRVTGVDFSEGMLKEARRKAHEQGLSIAFSVGDMRNLPVADASFDAVVCLFDSIGYARTDEGVGATLSGIRRALKSGGLFVMEFWHKATMLAAFEPMRVRWWPTEAGRLLRISETQLIENRDLAEVVYSIFELRNDGTYTALQETHINRYFAVAEMERLVREAGFESPEWHEGFSDDPVTDDTWHVVGVVRAISRY